MSLFTASLNSGSNGNCYYIGNADEAVLVDARISCRETEKRMARLGLSLKKVKAIFISHEHTDHISGMEVLSGKHNIPVYVTSKTLKAIGSSVKKELVRNFKPHEKIDIGNLKVIPFPKKHDAIDPHSFIVKNAEVCVGVMTDIGSSCENVAKYFKQCHAVFLETNYDSQMLENGAYPIHLKRRISGDNGHLSNDQAVELFLWHRSSFLSHVFLSHLSKENNTPQAAALAFERHAGAVKFIVASRYKETALFRITSNDRAEKNETILLPGIQTSLF